MMVNYEVEVKVVMLVEKGKAVRAFNIVNKASMCGRRIFMS